VWCVGVLTWCGVLVSACRVAFSLSISLSLSILKTQDNPTTKHHTHSIHTHTHTQHTSHTDIYISLVSFLHKVVPKNRWVAVCSANVETKEPGKELFPALRLLGKIDERYVYVCGCERVCVCVLVVWCLSCVNLKGCIQDLSNSLTPHTTCIHTNIRTNTQTTVSLSLSLTHTRTHQLPMGNQQLRAHTT